MRLVDSGGLGGLGPRAHFHGDVVLLGRVRSGDRGGLVEVAGIKKQQGGDGPLAVFVAGELDPGARDARREAARLESVAAGVLLAGPEGNRRLAVRLGDLGKVVGALAEEDHERLHDPTLTQPPDSIVSGGYFRPSILSNRWHLIDRILVMNRNHANARPFLRLQRSP